METSMSDLSPSHPVTIIGAGLSGLACARFLQDAGIESVVFDRGRHPGGRVATKQIAHKEDLHLFNHGAPKLDCFEQETRDWLARSGFDALTSSHELVLPHMRSVPARLAEGIRLERSTHVERLVRDGNHWRILAKRYKESDLVSQVSSHIVFACPPQQAMRVLKASSLRIPQELEEIHHDAQWVLMLVVDHADREALPRFQDDHPLIESLEWYENGETDQIIVRMRPDESTNHYDTDPEEIKDLMIRQMQDALDGWVAPNAIQASAVHRWGLARARQHIAQACITCQKDHISYAGDHFGGPDGTWKDADAAILSGLHCARSIIA